jgi:hypothetical protein
MSKLSIITIATSTGVILLLALLVKASPLVWIASLATDLFFGIFPALRALKLVPVEASSGE